MNHHTVELTHSKAWNLPLLQVESRDGKAEEEKRQVNPTLKPLPVALCMIGTATFAVGAKEEERREPKPQQVQAQLKGREYLSRRSHERRKRVGRIVPVVGIYIGIGGHDGKGPRWKVVGSEAMRFEVVSLVLRKRDEESGDGRRR